MPTNVQDIQYANRIESLRNAFRTREADASDLRLVLIFTIIVACMFALMVTFNYLRKRWSGESTPVAPFRFFGRCLKQLNVALPDRLLMRRIAWYSQLPQPAVMLFHLPLFQEKCDDWLDSTPLGPLRELAARRIRAVSRRAFEIQGAATDHAAA